MRKPGLGEKRKRDGSEAQPDGPDPAGSPAYVPSVFLLLFASRPAPTISSSEMSSSCRNRQKPSLSCGMKDAGPVCSGHGGQRGSAHLHSPLLPQRSPRRRDGGPVPGRAEDTGGGGTSEGCLLRDAFERGCREDGAHQWPPGTGLSHTAGLWGVACLLPLPHLPTRSRGHSASTLQGRRRSAARFASPVPFPPPASLSDAQQV